MGMSDSPRSIVASHVIGGVKSFLELLQIKIAAVTIETSPAIQAPNLPTSTGQSAVNKSTTSDEALYQEQPHSF